MAPLEDEAQHEDVNLLEDAAQLEAPLEHKAPALSKDLGVDEEASQLDPALGHVRRDTPDLAPASARGVRAGQRGVGKP